jgi:hypothetical protein
MGGFYPAGSIVALGDLDINTPLKYSTTHWGPTSAPVRHRDTGATASRYDFGEFIYKDADNSLAVSAGDIRYSNVPGYNVGSIVANGDTDIGGSLVNFMGTTSGAYESFSDNLFANNAYDFARLFVDILWNTDIPDNTADGMRGWQLYAQVDPNVLTPLGYVGGDLGYVLMDYLGNIGSSLTTGIVSNIGTDTIDVSEQILGTVTEGAGDIWSGGKLITLVFIPQSQTAYSLIDLLDTTLGYQDAGTEQWHTVTLVDGDYNARFMSLQPPTVLPPVVNPIGTQWHELYPTYSKIWTLTSWIDNGDGGLSASDQIDMTNETGWIYWFHVDVVTITIHWTFKTGPPPGGEPIPGEVGESEPETPMTEMPPGDPTGTRWHQIYPTYCRYFTITSWEDTGAISGTFDPSDQFDFEYDDEPGVTYWAHLDAVSTDIILSQKGKPEPPPVPEFPLGIGVIMILAPIIPLAYLWRTRKRVMNK